MIIWLASYPKSGNTWIRSIISSILFSNNGIIDNFELLNTIDQYPTKKYFDTLVTDYENPVQIQKNWIPSQDLINLDKKVKFLKTHHIYCKYGENAFTNSTNTLGVIHIVRDPRNVAISYSHHYQVTLDEAIKRICNNDLFIRKTEILPETFVSSWKLNYLSWSRLGKRVLLVKYEDLVKNKKKTMLKIFKFFEIQLGNH